jgi:hypothetical protein
VGHVATRAGDDSAGGSACADKKIIAAAPSSMAKSAGSLHKSEKRLLPAPTGVA